MKVRYKCNCQSCDTRCTIKMHRGKGDGAPERCPFNGAVSIKWLEAPKKPTGGGES